MQWVAPGPYGWSSSGNCTCIQGLLSDHLIGPSLYMSHWVPRARTEWPWKWDGIRNMESDSQQTEFDNMYRHCLRLTNFLKQDEQLPARLSIKSNEHFWNIHQLFYFTGSPQINIKSPSCSYINNLRQSSSWFRQSIKAMRFYWQCPLCSQQH